MLGLIHGAWVRLRFALERWLLRGTAHRLALFALITGVVALGGGLAVHATGAFETLGDAVWWAFLRLTDPGYLGDDQGTARRGISVVITILGYVLFMGTLIAIMTQWLADTLARLQRGETQLRREGHLLVVGWTNRTAAVIRELLLSESRARRILRRSGGRRLHVVVLAEHFGPALQAQIRSELGDLWDERRLTLRRGDRLVVGDLARVDYLRAAGVLLPGEDRDEAGEAGRDTTTIKALIAMTRRAGGAPLPPLVAEVFDPRRAELAREAYGGPTAVLASDQLVGRVLAQAVRHPGLSEVLGELLTHGRGNEIYQRDHGGLAGQRFGDAAERFEGGVLLGLLAGEPQQALLAPPMGTLIGPEDSLVVLAQRSGGAAISSRYAPPPTGRPRHLGQLAPPGCVLIVGWSPRVPLLIDELATASRLAGTPLHVHHVSPHPRATREAALEPTAASLTQTLHEADPTLPGSLDALPWPAIERVIVVAGTRADLGEETDARSVVSEMLIRRATEGLADPPDVLLELTHAPNAALFEGTSTEVIVTPLLVSHALAQVLLRPALALVFRRLFGADGPTLVLREASGFTPGTFAQVAAQARTHDAVLLGVSRPNRGLLLNPPRDTPLALGPEDRLVLIAPEEPEAP